MPSASSPSAPRVDASAQGGGGGTGGVRSGPGVPDASGANEDARAWSLDGGRDAGTSDGGRSPGDAATTGTGGGVSATGGAIENASGTGGSSSMSRTGGSGSGGRADGGRGGRPDLVDGGSAPAGGGSPAARGGDGEPAGGHNGGGSAATATGGARPGGEGGSGRGPAGGATDDGRGGAGGTAGGATGAGARGGFGGSDAVDALTSRVPRQGELRIDEVMVDPLGSDLGKEWIEIVNTSSDALDLSRLVVADDVSEHPLMASRPEAWTLQPGLVRVLGQSADRAKNGEAPVDLSYGTQLGLNNAADRVAICWVSCAELMLDEVRWDDSVAGAPGHALVMGAAGHRCPATTPYGPAVSGSLNAGTPGGPNDACP